MTSTLHIYSNVSIIKRLLDLTVNKQKEGFFFNIDAIIMTLFSLDYICNFFVYKPSLIDLIPQTAKDKTEQQRKRKQHYQLRKNGLEK